MPLTDLNLMIEPAEPPADVRTFLREAGRRVAQFQAECRVPAFVPCDYTTAYAVLRALAEADVAPGQLFCEWGSGYGVVACLAAMLDFDAHGIEIEGELVDAARELADDFGLAVEFVQGSFIPGGSAVRTGTDEDFAWLTTEPGATEDELGLGPADYDVVFAYPWPDEEQTIAGLFERHAAGGSVLVTYHAFEDVRVRRKARRRRKW